MLISHYSFPVASRETWERDLGMEDLRNNPVRQESESYENANKNEKAPTLA
jgi:hypothetical protein